MVKANSKMEYAVENIRCIFHFTEKKQTKQLR